MDLRSCSTIIGNPKMAHRMFKKRSRKDGTVILHIEKLNEEHGWTLEYFLFCDYLKTVEIEYNATWDERHCHKNQYVLRWKNEKNPGKVSIQDDFKRAARSLAMVKHQDGIGNAKIPPSGRLRQKADRRAVTFATLMAMSKIVTISWIADVILFILDDLVGTPTVARTGKDDMIGTDGRSGTNEYRFLEPPTHFANFLCQSVDFDSVDLANRHWRMSCTRRGEKTEHLTARTTSCWFPLCHDHQSASVRRWSLDHMQDRGPICCDIYKSDVRSHCLKLQLIIDSVQSRVDAAGKAAAINV